MHFDNALRFVLRWEGGYINHPNDPGGETNLGITKATLQQAQAASLVPAHVTPKTLTRDHAATIYRRRYWDPYNLDKVAWPVNLVVFDTVVNCGASGMAICVQRALVSLGASVATDGRWGPKTRAALIDMAKLHPKGLATAIIDARSKRYDRIVANKPKMGVFAKGWNNRLTALRKAANEEVL